MIRSPWRPTLPEALRQFDRPLPDLADRQRRIPYTVALADALDYGSGRMGPWLAREVRPPPEFIESQGEILEGPLPMGPDAPQVWRRLRPWQVAPVTVPVPDGPNLRGDDLPDMIAGFGDEARGSVWTSTAGELVGRSTAATGRPQADRRPGTWTARATFRAESHGEIWMALRLGGPSDIWVNRRRVWTSSPGPDGRPAATEGMFRTEVRGGENQILVRTLNPVGRLVRSHIHLSSRPPPPDGEPVGAAKVRLEHVVPEATPPLAWDLDRGVNVLWRVPLPGGGYRHRFGFPWNKDAARTVPDPGVVVAGDRLLVHAPPHTLVCLDRETGRELWRRDSHVFELTDPEALATWNRTRSERRRLELLKQAGLADVEADSLAEAVTTSAPATDGRRAWVHYSTGVAACYDLDGERRWMVRTHLGPAGFRILDGLMIIEGAVGPGFAPQHGIDPERFAPEPRPRGSPGDPIIHAHGMVSLDIDTGAVRWAAELRHPYFASPRVLEVPDAPALRDRGFVLSPSGQVLRSLDGELLYGHGLVSVLEGEGVGVGDRTFTVAKASVGAAQVYVDREGMVRRRRFWRRALHHHPSIGTGSHARGVSDGSVLMVWRQGSDWPVDGPSLILELGEYDLETGRRLHRLRGVLRGTSVPLQPVWAGDRLYLGDMRSEPGFGEPASERQIAVVRRGPPPVVLARNPAPGLAATPVADGDRLYLRLEDSVVCLAVRDEAGREFQDLQVARTVLGDLPPPPDPAPLPAGRSRAEPLPGIPVTRLGPGLSLADWVLAGLRLGPESGRSSRRGAGRADLPGRPARGPRRPRVVDGRARSRTPAVGGRDGDPGRRADPARPRVRARSGPDPPHRVPGRAGPFDRRGVRTERGGAPPPGLARGLERHRADRSPGRADPEGTVADAGKPPANGTEPVAGGSRIAAECALADPPGP